MSTRRWLALAVAGALVVIGSLAVWQATRPASSVGAPVAGAPVTGPTSPAPAGLAGSATATPSSSSTSATTRPTAVPTRDTSVAAPSDPTDQSGQTQGTGPRRLTVSALGIDAPVERVGVDPDGAMALPVDVNRVGWYQFSPKPGTTTGSVVLAGHVDSAEQGAGALFDLRTIDVGTRIVVQGSDGKSHAYRVTGREMIVKQRLPVERLFTLDGPPRLVIITCGGPFQKDLHSYRDNLVVAAEPVA